MTAKPLSQGCTILPILKTKHIFGGRKRLTGKYAMKSRLSHATVSWLIASLAVAGSACSTRSTPSAARTDIEPVSILDRLHPVFSDETQIVQHDFLVANAHERAVHFSRVSASCACTDAKLVKDRLQPGEKTVLRIEANLRGRSGTQTYSCTLEPDGNAQPWIFRASVPIYRHVSFSQQNFHLGNVAPNERVEADVGLELTSVVSDKSVRIASVQSPSKCLAVSGFTTNESAVADDWGVLHRSAKVHVTLLPQSVPGAGEPDLLAKYDFHGMPGEAMTRLRWFVTSSYVVSPPRVFFGDIKSTASPVRKTVCIRRADGKPVVVRGLEIKQPGLTCTVTDDSSNNGRRFTFNLDPSAVHGVAWSEILVRTSDRYETLIRIPFSAFRAVNSDERTGR